LAPAAANLEVARQLMSAAASTLDSTVQSVFLGALQAYYNAQAARAAVTAPRNRKKPAARASTAAEVRYRVGTGTPADRLQAQTAWSQATLNRIRSEGLLRNALGSLANVMGLDANQPLLSRRHPAARPTAGFDRDVAALIAEARRTATRDEGRRSRTAGGAAGIDYARAAGRPTVSLSAGPQWEDLGGASAHGNSIGLT
jgi:outer membrane protein